LDSDGIIIGAFNLTRVYSWHFFQLTPQIVLVMEKNWWFTFLCFIVFMKFLEKHYPILLALISMLYSVYLWFSGSQLEGLFVGLWPVTILAFSIAIRQRNT